MFKIYLIVAVIFILAILVKLFESFLTDKQLGYQYRKKSYLMTKSEHECFDALIETVGNTYHIFPQIHLSAILDHKVKGQSWRGAFSKINQKSVDFVLCDKVQISPVLAIELDDKSHERQDRIDRDGIVEEIFKNAEIPLLRIKNQDYANQNILVEKITLALNNSGK